MVNSFNGIVWNECINGRYSLKFCLSDSMSVFVLCHGSHVGVPKQRNGGQTYMGDPGIQNESPGLPFKSPA